jgi:hypothetical protein
VDWTHPSIPRAGYVASLIIAGIHAYLAFTSSSAASSSWTSRWRQIASLGAAIAVWQGYDAHDPDDLLDEPWLHADWRGHLRDDQGPGERYPQEAIIGISYALPRRRSSSR